MSPLVAFLVVLIGSPLVGWSMVQFDRWMQRRLRRRRP